jgi:hypothetical protein
MEKLTALNLTLTKEVVEQERHWIEKEMPAQVEQASRLYPTFLDFVSSLAKFIEENKEHLKNLSIYEFVFCSQCPDSVVEKWEQVQGEILTPILKGKGPRKATDVVLYAPQHCNLYISHIIPRLDSYTPLELATWEALNLVNWFRRRTIALLKLAKAEAEADRYSNQVPYAIEAAIQLERDLEYLGYNLLEQIEEFILNGGWNSQEVAEWQAGLGKQTTPAAVRQRRKRRREALDILRNLQDFRTPK